MNAGSNVTKWALAAATLAASAAWAPQALAQAADPERWQLNMGRGVTHLSEIAYESHMIVLWICVIIGLLVFGAMFLALFKFRKSKGAVAAQFSHNTTAEVIWTIVPIIILIGLAWPATANLIKMYDTRNAEMTVKVTGYQWMWKYEYLGEGVEFTSRLARDSDAMRQSGEVPDVAANPNYLLEVDNQLVLPTDTKIRFVITADDVIHAWWVPALGWKQDAIPGFVNEAWTDISVPGVYRGQCAELCGKDHGFMPIVVRAVPRAEFDAWLAERKAETTPSEASAASDPVAIDPAGEGTGPRQEDPEMVEEVLEGEEPTAPPGLQPENRDDVEPLPGQ